MSSIAGQLILHPKLTQGLAVLATTTGRDKVCDGRVGSTLAHSRLMLMCLGISFNPISRKISRMVVTPQRVHRSG